MTFFQKSTSSDTSSAVLKANSKYFVEMIGESESDYLFNLSFMLDSTNKNKDLSKYDKVVLTVRRKEDSNSLSSEYSNYSTKDSLKSANNVEQLRRISGDGNLRPLYTNKVFERITSNITILRDSTKTEPYLERIEIPISRYLQDIKGSAYSFTEIFATPYKRQGVGLESQNLLTKSNNYIFVAPGGASEIKSNNMVERINDDLCDLTSFVTDEHLSHFTSETLLENPVLKESLTKRGKSILGYDVAKYLLKEIKPGPEEDTMTWYEKRKTTKVLSDITIEQPFSIKKNNKNFDLIVRLDLCNRESNSIDESLDIDINFSSLLESYMSVIHPPEIRVSKSSMIMGRNFESEQLIFLSIIDKDKTGKIKSFNVYSKNISRKGEVTSYILLENVKNIDIPQLSFKAQSKLTVVRVIPVDESNVELNVFSDCVIGPGYDAIENLSITTSHSGKNEIRVEVFNLPKNVISLTLYKRDCSSFSSNFSDISFLRTTIRDVNAVFIDKEVSLNKIYEYYVVALTTTTDKSQEIPIVSNFSIIKSPQGFLVDKAVSVEMENPSFLSTSSETSFSFLLKTTITPSENERITNTLKEQLGEIYEQFLNPSSNSSSPLGTDSKGIPQYSDLFFHEIIRTNLTTGEREVFDLVSDGLFEDKKETQKIFNIKPINPENSYRYQIFTYKKNPIELFKNFVARGTDEKGKDWFYLPNKWKNPKTKSGYLYPDDNQGNPIVSTHEKLTSESFGMTASHQTNPIENDLITINVICERIDRKNVKISWDTNEQIIKYVDSFIVLLVSNGVRKILGRTCLNYIYHRITEEDLGSNYYIVIPITSTFKFLEPSYSNVLVLVPESIVEKTKVTSVKSLEVASSTTTIGRG